MVHREFGQKYLMPLMHGVFLDVSHYGVDGPARRGASARILRNRPRAFNRENAGIR